LAVAPRTLELAMTDYVAPIADIRFALRHAAEFDAIVKLPGYEEATPDVVGHILEEAGKFASEVVGPLNRIGDREGSRLENGVVRTPAGFKDAYKQFVASGWNSVAVPADHGGQGLPWVLNAAVTEMWDSANTAWSLCPMLTVGAIEAISAHGTAEQKHLYLPHLVRGEWTGTMNLTEPQAGSDVGALRTRAVRDENRFRLFGQKIFITYGDQDYTDNVVHLVLARIEGAPPGVKGISLFLVPKVLVNADGSLGPRNDLRPVSLEHKLGIHASPTAVMTFGENDGAFGTLIGRENEGMACMFTMMNNARFNVGMLGLGTAERAWQQARAFARERVQGRDIATGENDVPIIRHPDVRRMLLSMKASTEAMRALAYFLASRLDIAKRHPEPEARTRAQATVDLLTPVMKAWCTDTGCEVAHTGVQVHGGMGFIEETGAAQHLRDARIHPIYEGTNGIQANDLIGRKVQRDGGAAARTFVAEMRPAANSLASAADADLAAIGRKLDGGLDCLNQATDWIVAMGKRDPRLAAAGAVPYLTLFGNVTAGWLMGRQALAAANARVNGSGNGYAEGVNDLDPRFCAAKVKTARFFADHVLVRSRGLHAAVVDGGEAVVTLAEADF
jgi:alkylation response protein AidB-like acyl-CoA dehydrogenase